MCCCRDVHVIFPGDSRHEMIKHILYILRTLGMPPENLINAGFYSSKYFPKSRGQYQHPGTSKPKVKIKAGVALVYPISSLKKSLMESHE